MKYERCYFKQVSSIKKSICSQTFSLVVTEGSLYALTLSTLSPTVPGGDTPCLTAGDARRANPWRSDALTSDAGGVAQQPHFCTSELPPPRFQCDAAGVGIRVVCLSTGSPSLWLGYHPRLRMVRLRRRRYSVWMWMRRRK